MALYKCEVCFKLLDSDHEPPVSHIGYDLVCPTCHTEYLDDEENNSEF